MSISETEKIISIVNLIKSNDKNSLQELKKHENLKDFSYLFTALVYCKDPEVFKYLYNHMNKENNIQFDEEFFSSHKFSIKSREEGYILPQLYEFTVDQKIKNSLYSTKSTSDPINMIFNENIETIQNNLFFNKDMALFQKPLNELPKILEELLTTLILQSNINESQNCIDYINKFSYNRFLLIKSLFESFDKKEIHENAMNALNPKIFSHLININSDLIDDPIVLRKYVEKTIHSNSLEGFNLLINTSLDICKHDSKAGITYFDLLIKNSFEAMKDAGGYKKDGHGFLDFYDEAIFNLTQVFDSYKESYLFKKEKQSAYDIYRGYAKYFHLEKTLSIMERAKIDQDINVSFDKKEEVKRRM